MQLIHDIFLMLKVLSQDETPLLYSIVFGEGVVNDATSIVLFNAVQSLDVKDIDPLTALKLLGTFLYLFLTSTALGIAVSFCFFIFLFYFFGCFSCCTLCVSLTSKHDSCFLSHEKYIVLPIIGTLKLNFRFQQLKSHSGGRPILQSFKVMLHFFFFFLFQSFCLGVTTLLLQIYFSK